MKIQPTHNTGKNIFRPGESVYINRTTEQIESHLHTHDFIEIAYVASGEGTHQINGKKYSVSKGDIFLINYNVAHEFRSLPDKSKPRLVVYNCIFKPEFIDYTLINCKGFHHIANHFLFRSLFPNEAEAVNDLKVLGKDCYEIEELYMKMYSEYTQQKIGYIEILRAYVIELFVNIIRLYNDTEKIENRINIRRRNIVENAMIYMKENYDKELKLEDISMMSFFSRNYFCRMFKETTGMTVSEYIQKIRIQEACRLLKETDNTVIDIAQQVGYKDIKFFNKVFKRNVGLTPGKYRESL